MRRLCYALIVLFAVPALAAEVYRSVAENGTVIYSDRPDREGTERITVATTRPATQAARSDNSPEADSEDQDPGSEALNSEVRQEPTAQELADERAKNCAIAQERAEQYRVAHRLYRNLPNGEREYLSDAELDQVRAKAESDVAAWCD